MVTANCGEFNLLNLWNNNVTVQKKTADCLLEC